MHSVGIRETEQIEVTVRRGDEFIGAIVITAVAKDAVSAEIYCDDGQDLLVMHEAFKVAANTVDYHIHSPRLKDILETRIAEIKKWIAEGNEGEPPFPTADDIPF